MGGIGMSLCCSWKDLDEQDLMESIWYDLGNIDFINCDFYPWKFKYIPKKPGFVLEGKISWGRGNTWANGTGHTSEYNKPNISKSRCSTPLGASPPVLIIT